MVWMRNSALPQMRKLFGRIEQDFKKGDKLTLVITNNYSVEAFKGKKSVVFATTNAFGGQCYNLAYCFFIAGAYSTCYTFFLLYKKFSNKQKN